MELSRRNFCASGAGLALFPLASPALGKRLRLSPEIIEPSPGIIVPSTEYSSTLVDGYTPSPISCGGRLWDANMGSAYFEGMDHCLRVTNKRARFELRNTKQDRGTQDPDTTKRRSELNGSVSGDPTRLPNNVTLWGAMQFNHHSWADPAGMEKLWGGVHGQIHMGKFGGSPALAFRRNSRGAFKITTRGEFDTGGTTRYQKPLSFDKVHDLVYRVNLHERGGALTVWLDGQKIVDVFGASIGSSRGGSYWNVGLYYAGGIACPIVAEYGNHVYPNTKDLSARIGSPPAWGG